MDHWKVMISAGTLEVEGRLMQVREDEGKEGEGRMH